MDLYFFIGLVVVPLGAMIHPKIIWDNFIVFVMLILSGVLLFTFVLTIPVNRMVLTSEIQGFKAVVQVVNTDRQEGNIENAALKLKIAESNQWLAKTQYYAQIFNWHFPREVFELEAIK
uniref:Uncharacterized protein n=1 Tax=viral metagenome TaxID=1070528 RepID=A0A6H1Z9N3_9ZZZZ